MQQSNMLGPEAGVLDVRITWNIQQWLHLTEVKSDRTRRPDQCGLLWYGMRLAKFRKKFCGGPATTNREEGSSDRVYIIVDVS